MRRVIVMLRWLVGMIVHVAHHKEMCERAKQCQSNIDYSIDRDIKQKYRRQPDDGKQTAKQHDPEMTLIH
jgi:hypothetical protein